eukprot:301610-Karenia_brevis.AAC.1
MSKEEKAKLMNVYLRPWTLIRETATEQVPYICDLDVYAPGTRSHRKAWRQYINGNIVREYAARIIKKILLA